MNKFFNYDGPFVRFGTLLFDVMMISILWSILSGIIPGFVLLATGALVWAPTPVALLILFILYIHWFPATVALVYTFGKRQRGNDTYILRDYWHSFSTNYKQSMILTAVLSVGIVLIIYNLWILSKNGSMFGALYFVVLPVEFLALAELIFISIYTTGLVARFEMKTKEYFRYGFLMANKHLLTTVILTVAFVAAFIVCLYVNPIFLVIVPGAYTYLQAALLERVFKNYMPDQDQELEEEELEGFSLDAERQAIIDRYLNQTRYDDTGDYSYVTVEDGKEVVQRDNYKIVRVENPEEQHALEAPAAEEEAAEEEEMDPENMSEDEKYLL